MGKTYFIRFISVKVKYYMQTTKEKYNPWKRRYYSYKNALLQKKLTKYNLSMILYSPTCKWFFKYIGNKHSIIDFHYWWQINETPSCNELKGLFPCVFSMLKIFTDCMWERKKVHTMEHSWQRIHFYLLNKEMVCHTLFFFIVASNFIISLCLRYRNQAYIIEDKGNWKHTGQN